MSLFLVEESNQVCCNVVHQSDLSFMGTVMWLLPVAHLVAWLHALHSKWSGHCAFTSSGWLTCLLAITGSASCMHRDTGTIPYSIHLSGLDTSALGSSSIHTPEPHTPTYIRMSTPHKSPNLHHYTHTHTQSIFALKKTSALEMLARFQPISSWYRRNLYRTLHIPHVPPPSPHAHTRTSNQLHSTYIVWPAISPFPCPHKTPLWHHQSMPGQCIMWINHRQWTENHHPIDISERNASHRTTMVWQPLR